MMAAMLVALHADEAPVVERVPEARIAGIPHADEETFAALPRNRRHASLGAQPMIISGRQEPRGLRKHRGGDDSPDAWQGPEDRHVTMPLVLPCGGESVQQALDAPRTVAPLAVDKLTKFAFPSAGTFNCRTVKDTGVRSMHAWGAAIDLNTQIADYWLWNPKNPYRNRIPADIVDIFEKHGFIWGGKWAHFDTMHFEYRPELL
jgi:hypothetical protein